MRSTAAAALAAALLLPAGLAAQQQGGAPGAQPPAGPPEEPTELVFEREVYSYPDYERRNPFRPLVSQDEAGPRFELLRLLGVIYSNDPQRSVALFGVGGGGEGGVTYRLRVGDVLGNTRVMAIDRDRVLVEVEEFGVTEERVLELPRRGQGGSR